MGLWFQLEQERSDCVFRLCPRRNEKMGTNHDAWDRFPASASPLDT